MIDYVRLLGMPSEPGTHERAGRDDAELVLACVVESRLRERLRDAVATFARRDRCMLQIDHSGRWQRVRQLGVPRSQPHDETLF